MKAACESCHGIVDGKHVELESLRQQVTLLRDELRMALGIIDPEEYPHTVAGIKKALDATKEN